MTSTTLLIVFAVAWVIFFIISMMSRGAMNSQNVAQHGIEADYRADPSGAIVGCIFAGAIYAGILTGIIWFALG